MTIRKRTGGLLVTAATTAAVIGLCAAPALASSPLSTTKLTVKVSGGGKFTTRSSKTVLTDKVSGTTLKVTCTTKGKKVASSAAGNIPNGTHKGNSPVQVGTASKLTFNNCTGPLGPVRTKVLVEPYKVSVDSKTNRKGQTDGFISGIKVQVFMTSCSFVVTGSAPGFYTNSKHTLTMTSTLPVRTATKTGLTISGVKKGTCLGVIKNGQHPGFNSVFTLSRKGTITSK